MTLYEFEGRVPEVAPTAYVAPSAQVVGRVVIGADCYVGHGVILRGDYGTILVGDGTAVEDGVIVHARPGDTTRFGKRVTVGHGAVLHNCTVHDGAVIGMGAIVSDYAVVEEWAVVAEGAVVKNKGHVPSRHIAVGVPAKVIGQIDEEYERLWSSFKDIYVSLASERYPKGLRRVD